MKLRDIRIKKGLTQQDIADILGFKRNNSISRVELGQSVLNQEQIIKLCKALDVRAGQLLGLEDLDEE